MKWPRSRIRWTVAGALVTAGILVACFLPPMALPGPKGFPMDKVAHLVAFALFAFSWRNAELAKRLVLALAGGLALVTEGGQALFLATRSGDWADAAADILGAVAGVALARPWSPRVRDPV